MATAYDTANIIIPKSAGYKSGSLYGWNPQGGSLVDFAVTRAGATATRVNEAGLIESVAANVPRIDWAEGGSCPSLLVEPQRTNIFPQDLSGSGVVTRTITVANATVYSVSVKGSGSMALSGAGTGTVSDGSPVTFTSSSTSLTLTLTGSLNYCQVEAGGYATSIIFTELVQETRNADVIQKTGIASLLGQSAGSIFFEVSYFSSSDANYIALEGGSNRALLFVSSGNITWFCRKNGSTQAIITGLSITPNTYYKIAARYAVNSFALYIDSTQQGTDTNGQTYSGTDLNQINFGTSESVRFYGRIRVGAVYNYALDNTELANITT